MSQQLDEILLHLHVLALKDAKTLPSPKKPPSAAAEKATDDYCRQFVADRKIVPPPPRVATVLAARLRPARMFASVVESSFAQQAAMGDRAANDAAVLEWLLIKMWHESWRAKWIEGVFQ